MESPYKKMIRFLLSATVVIFLSAPTQGQPNPGDPGSKCPPPEEIMPCRCRDKNEQIQVWCSHSDLERVNGALGNLMRFRAMPSIDELIVENNRMTKLPARAFGALRIGRLLLRNNGLESVSRNAFAGLENFLEELYIVEEKLTDFPFDCIENLVALEAFTIEQSQIRLLPRFNGLNRLKHIRIDGSKIEGFPVGAFAQMASVKQIHIVNSDVGTLANGIFGPLETLLLANFSGNRIIDVQRRSFALLPKLEVLSLVGNRIEDAIGVGRACEDLTSLKSLELAQNKINKLSQGTFVNLRSLQMLNLAENVIDSVRPRALSHLPGLRKVDLTDNFIRELPKNFLDHTPMLEDLRMRGNRLGSANEMGEMLNSLKGLRHLDISQNGIESLHTGAFQNLLQMTRLDLSDNQIKRIHRNAFKNVPNLIEMSLRNNSIEELPTDEEWEIKSLKELDISQNILLKVSSANFRAIPELVRLDLGYNHLKKIDPGTFSPLSDLEYLDLSGNGLNSFSSESLRGLSKLTRFDLSRNHLINLQTGTFSDCKSLQILNLANNRFRSVENGLLGDLRALEELNLKGNSIRIIPAGFFRSLESLRQLSLKNNAIEDIPSGLFNSLKSLEVLKLASNQIIRIGDGAFDGLSQLKVIDLTSNRLNRIRRSSFRNLPSLEKLEIRENRISEVEDGALGDSVSLQICDIAHNALKSIKFVSSFSVIKVIDASHNLIEELDPELLGNCPELVELYLNDNRLSQLRPRSFYNLPMLTILDLDGNELGEISQESFSSLPKLIYLRLSRNKIRNIRSQAFSQLIALDGIDLQENELEEIDKGGFDRISSLKYLNLSHNNFDRMEKMDLASLTSLEVLDSSFNQVQELDENSLKHLQWLVELRLNDNGICRLPLGIFDGMSRLKMLILKNNFITHLFETVFYRLKNNIAFIDISGNPISCDCDLIWLRNLISRDVIQEVSDGTCAFPDDLRGSHVRSVRPARMVCQNSIHSRQSPPSKYNDKICPKLTQSRKRIRPPRIHQEIVAEERPIFGGHPSDSDYFTETENNDLKNQRKDEKAPESNDYIPGDTPTIYAGNSNKHLEKVKAEGPKKSTGFGGLGSIFGIPLPSLDFGLNLGISPSISLGDRNEGGNRGFAPGIKGPDPLPSSWIERPSKADILSEFVQSHSPSSMDEAQYEPPQYIPRKPHQPYIPLNPYAASEASPIMSTGSRETLSRPIKFPSSGQELSTSGHGSNKGAIAASNPKSHWANPVPETETGFIPIEPFFHGQNPQQSQPQKHQGPRRNKKPASIEKVYSTTLPPPYSIEFGPTTLPPINFQDQFDLHTTERHYKYTTTPSPFTPDYEIAFANKDSGGGEEDNEEEDVESTTTRRKGPQEEPVSLSDFWNLFSGGSKKGGEEEDDEEPPTSVPFNFSAPIDDLPNSTPSLNGLEIDLGSSELTDVHSRRTVGRPSITKLTLEDLDTSSPGYSLEHGHKNILQDIGSGQNFAAYQESSRGFSHEGPRSPPVHIGSRSLSDDPDWYYRNYNNGQNAGEELERYLERSKRLQLQDEDHAQSFAIKLSIPQLFMLIIPTLLTL